MKPIKKATIILCIAAVVCAVLVYGAGTNHQLKVETEINVSSGLDVRFRGEGMYNDTIYLTKDITVNGKAHFGSSEYPFKGTLDGRGHTIYLDYTDADNDTSLFGYIAEGAIIRNVNFVYKNVVVNGNAFGGVAKINDGIIENCKVVFDNIELTGEGLFSPFVTVNRGTISGVVIQGKISGGVSNIDEDKLLYGSVCVYNKGAMSSLIADVEYEGFDCTSREEYDNGNVDNVSISAVRYDDLEDGKTERACAVVPTTQIVSDRNDEQIISLSADELYVYTKVYETLLFENEHWELGDNDISLVIKGKAK